MNARRTIGALTAAAAWCALAQTAPGLQVRNTYRYHGQGRYEWRVFLKEDQATLGRINCVEYTLHPTFPDPVRRVCDANGGFALGSEGWGEFTVLLKIEWKDGRATRQQYRLDLHSPPAAPGAPPTAFAQAPAQAVGQAHPVAPPKLGAIRTGNTARPLGAGQWAWTVFIAADEHTLGQIECVQYTLHPTYPDPIQKVCERGKQADVAFPYSNQGWGTFEVGIKVQLKGGSARYLSHMLRFESQK
jgi:transcription initiation factor IIF auxiliary subunit